MNEITIFKNEQFGEIRTEVIDGEVWFVGKDIAEALGYLDPSSAVSKKVDKDDKITLPLKQGEINRTSQSSFINESGMYTLILGSELESAKEFKHWVTSEILPSIRKTGTYTVNQTSDKEIEAKRAEIYLKLAEGRTDRYGDILKAYATKELSGEFLLPLPKSEKKTYSATEIDEILGVSSNKIGSIANKNNLKTEQYGEWFIDKSRYSNKEVRVFRYYESTIKVFKRFIEQVA